MGDSSIGVVLNVSTALFSAFVYLSAIDARQVEDAIGYSVDGYGV